MPRCTEAMDCWWRDNDELVRISEGEVYRSKRGEKGDIVVCAAGQTGRQAERLAGQGTRACTSTTGEDQCWMT